MIRNMQYIQIPKTITYEDLTERRSLSPSNYRTLSLKNKNVKKVRELLSELPQKGEEVGSFSYINKSNLYFIRTKALQASYFLPVLNDVECAVPILPMVFRDFKLCKGDILMSKDANIGDTAYLNEDLPNFMISGGIFRLRFADSIKYYVFAFMKNGFFRNQIDSMVSRGATIKHAKTLWLGVIIPFPNQQNKNEIIEFVGLLTKAVIRKEAEVRLKDNRIINLIDEDLKNNQNPRKYQYSYPTINELQKINRLDTSLFCEDFKEKDFKISNYSLGYTTITQLNFEISRGQNLQVSCIGRSIYKDTKDNNYYALFLPTHITRYGTIEKTIYLGNPLNLKTLKEGDIIFGAEGFKKGRSILITEDLEKTITNIHGVTLHHKDNNFILSVFVRCFLNYLRDEKIIDYLAVGGQGGSLAQRYWETLKFPNFPEEKQKEIAKYYYNPVSYDFNKLNLEEFEQEDIKITKLSGILQLDKQIKNIKEKLNMIIQKIIFDEEVFISFDFLELNKNAEEE